jgi:hypothetical protein
MKPISRAATLLSVSALVGAAVACAIPALLIGVASIDVNALFAAFGERAPRRLVAAFATATAVMLTLAWLKGIVARIAARDFGWPSGEAAIGHVVHALDLGLQVPLAAATALLLLRRRPAGHLAAFFRAAPDARPQVA